jgi:hypothetical protein
MIGDQLLGALKARNSKSNEKERCTKETLNRKRRGGGRRERGGGGLNLIASNTTWNVPHEMSIVK